MAGLLVSLTVGAISSANLSAGSQARYMEREWEDLDTLSGVSNCSGYSGINLPYTTSHLLNSPWEVACGSTPLYLKYQRPFAVAAH